MFLKNVLFEIGKRGKLSFKKFFLNAYHSEKSGFI